MEFADFEWDDDKNVKNIRRHGIDFLTAIQAFDDAGAIPYTDSEHSRIGEARYALIGMCPAGLVFVSFTYRGELCRIISARKASKQMQKDYAKND